MAKATPDKYIINGTNLKHLGKDALIEFARKHFGLTFSSHKKRNVIVERIVRAEGDRAKAVETHKFVSINGHNHLADSPTLIPGTEPLEARLEKIMMGVANHCDVVLNPDQEGPDRKLGFVLLVFPFNAAGGKVNYLTNGADRAEIIRLMQAQIDGFENDGEDNA
jgi:hypothetical protein